MAVKMGNVYRVTNKGARRGEVDVYNVVKVEGCDGGDERWLMFTDKEVAKFAEYDVCGEIGQFKSGRLYKFIRKGGVSKFLVELVIDGVEKVILIAERLVDVAYARACKNGEDIPKQSWFQDLVD